MILKLSQAVESAPWNLFRAAEALRLWVRGLHQRPPLLDISYILDSIKRRRPLCEIDPQTYWVDTQGGTRAVGLEPVMNNILINRPRHTPSGETSVVPSARSEFVYSVAAELHCQHRYTWDAGIEVGERCFQRLAKQQQVALSKDGAQAGEADEMPLLDVADRQNL